MDKEKFQSGPVTGSPQEIALGLASLVLRVSTEFHKETIKHKISQTQYRVDDIESDDPNKLRWSKEERARDQQLRPKVMCVKWEGYLGFREPQLGCWLRSSHFPRVRNGLIVREGPAQKCQSSIHCRSFGVKFNESQ